MTATLILLRHGESEWNLANRFTGWIDVDLSDKGREEAVRGRGAYARAADACAATAAAAAFTASWSPR